LLVNEWVGHDGEPTLADVQREYPGWECWRGVSGLYYARRPGRPRRHAAEATGEDPLDLRHMIVRVLGREEASTE
jgi:hypothetical protein